MEDNLAIISSCPSLLHYYHLVTLVKLAMVKNPEFAIAISMLSVTFLDTHTHIYIYTCNIYPVLVAMSLFWLSIAVAEL